MQLQSHALSPRVSLSFLEEPELEIAVSSNRPQNVRLVQAALTSLLTKFLLASAGRKLTVGYFVALWVNA